MATRFCACCPCLGVAREITTGEGGAGRGGGVTAAGTVLGTAAGLYGASAMAGWADDGLEDDGSGVRMVESDDLDEAFVFVTEAGVWEAGLR